MSANDGRFSGSGSKHASAMLATGSGVSEGRVGRSWSSPTESATCAYASNEPAVVPVLTRRCCIQQRFLLADNNRTWHLLPNRGSEAVSWTALLPKHAACNVVSRAKHLDRREVETLIGRALRQALGQEHAPAEHIGLAGVQLVPDHLRRHVHIRPRLPCQRRSAANFTGCHTSKSTQSGP